MRGPGYHPQKLSLLFFFYQATVFQFLPRSFFNKKLEIEKTKPTIVIVTFKTDKTNVGLVFFEFQLFLFKNLPG